MTRQDIVYGYLHSLKKTFNEDQEESWISTHNNRASCYLAFWKWLTQPDIKREGRQTPPQVKGVIFPKKKSKTHIRREHFWTDEEHKVFLKYCEDHRLACYHAIARDTGGRPGELLDLKISDLQIQTSPSTGKKYAEFTIGDRGGGKMKKPRPVNISDAIPYLNVWLAVHPSRDSPQGAYLFPSREMKSRYRNVPLKPDSLRLIYIQTIEEQFPKLLDRPDIPLEDKMALKSLIYDKPHFPYLLRHEFSTEIAPTISQQSFNQLLGHSKSSRMYEVYVHDLGNEGNKELMIARGIIKRDEIVSPAQAELKPKYCPICHEANKYNADFCFKCNWIISKKGMEEVREKDETAAKETENIKKQLAELKQNQDKMINTAESMTRLEEWIKEYRALDMHKGEGLPHNLEAMIWYYLQGDPEQGSDISEEEFARRNREFPELVAAVRKLQARRLAAANDNNNDDDDNAKDKTDEKPFSSPFR